MTGRSTSNPSNTRSVFAEQAEHCAVSSPLYAELCRRFADEPVVGEIIGPEPSWDDPLDAHREFLSEFVREQRVQTNEVQRAWVLTPLFLRVAERTGAASFDLIELGASAGLLLGWAGFLLQVVALSLLPFVVVQPVLAAGLLLMLYLGVRMLGERVGVDVCRRRPGHQQYSGGGGEAGEDEGPSQR